jgi:hypothetical protein
MCICWCGRRDDDVKGVSSQNRPARYREASGGEGVEIVGLAAREGAQLIAGGLIGDEKWHSEPRDESGVIWNGERPAGGVKPQRHNESMANRSTPPAHSPVSTPDPPAKVARAARDRRRRCPWSVRPTGGCQGRQHRRSLDPRCALRHHLRMGSLLARGQHDA